MSFQWIVNSAESISINRKKIVASTTARDGTVKAVTRGSQPYRFEIKVPDGIAWTTLKADIESAEALDRYTTATITIPYAKFPWFYNNTPPGTDLSYTVLCTEFPEWTIFARDQVSWSGPFVFVEV